MRLMTLNFMASSKTSKSKVIKRKVYLTFPAAKTREAVICDMYDRYKVRFNIRSASVTDNLGLIALELEAPLEQLEKAFTYFRSRGVKVERRDEVAQIVAEDVSVWQAGAELVLEEVAKSGMLPGRIYLCGGGARLPQISAALRDPEFAHQLPFARPPQVEAITVNEVAQIKDATGLLVDEQDIPPMALAHQALEMSAAEAPKRRISPHNPATDRTRLDRILKTVRRVHRLMS